MNHQNEDIPKDLVLLLESNVGYGIDLFDLLKVYQLGDGRFAVNRYEIKAGKNSHAEEQIYENAHEAVETFELWRKQYEIGFDFERIGENI